MWLEWLNVQRALLEHTATFFGMKNRWNRLSDYSMKDRRIVFVVISVLLPMVSTTSFQ